MFTKKKFSALIYLKENTPKKNPYKNNNASMQGGKRHTFGRQGRFVDEAIAGKDQEKSFPYPHIPQILNMKK